MGLKISLLKYFEEDFLNEKGIKGVFRKEKLFSRKNDVYKVDVVSGEGKRIYVLKKYMGEDRYSRMKNELLFYDLFGKNGPKVPNIFYNNEEILVTEFIGSKTLLDYIVEKEVPVGDKVTPETDSPNIGISPIFEACKYILDFNRMLKNITGKSYMLNDMNFRNFLFTTDGVCRVDLEECRPGDIEEDLGKFIAFFLTYDPPYTEWKMSASSSIRKFCRDTSGIDISRVELETSRELDRMAERRR